MSAIAKSCAVGATLVTAATGVFCSTPNPPARVIACNPVPVVRADGTLGTAVDIEATQLDGLPYPSAVAANFVKGIGATCDPVPPGYVRVSGVLADGTGQTWPESEVLAQHKAGGLMSVVYPYYVKS